MDGPLQLGQFTIDPAAGELVGPAGREQLDPKVMQVLVVLAQSAGAVVPRQALMDAVWPGVVVGDDVVSRCIYQLRRHLRQAGGDEHHALLIETLPKRGYRLHGGPAADDGRLAPATDRVGRRRWPLVVAMLLALMVTTGVAGWLRRIDYFWQNPLAHARFTRLTDVEGVAPGVAISRDGQRIAFLAARHGRLDAWTTQVGKGEFTNLTQGGVPEIDTPVRSLNFSPDASQLAMWTRTFDDNGKERIDTWTVATAGGTPRPFMDDVSELDWSPDGRRMVYHPAAPGDPLLIADAGGKGARQIFIAPNGVHCHFPVWSRDARFIYFVHGRPPDDMDIWRIAAAGGKPERITFHGARVSFPVFLDATTLLYLATAEDGSGPWLYGMDSGRRVPHRVGLALEQYTSLASSADGRRLVATRATPRTSLWRVPIMDRVAVEADAQRIPLPAAGGRSPRWGPGYLVFVSPSDGSGIRKLGQSDRALTELWRSTGRELASGPALDPARRHIAFSITDGGVERLRVMNADGGGLRALAPDLTVTGAPTWTPDGRSIIVAADQGQGTRLFKVAMDGSPAVPFSADYARDAAWSPDGGLLVFSGADVGPVFPVGAMTANGRPHPLPELHLPRGARRLVFLPGSNSLVVLKGPARARNFWLVDLVTGRERQLTDFQSGFSISDFDVSADGRELVFDQLREEADVVQIDLARAR